MAIGFYTASNSGVSVSNQARDVVEQLVKRSLGSTAQYVAETMTKKVGAFIVLLLLIASSYVTLLRSSRRKNRNAQNFSGLNLTSSFKSGLPCVRVLPL